MSVDPDLIQRSGELKAQLVRFVQQPRFDRAWDGVVAEHIVSLGGSDAELINLFDAFLLQHRLPDGRTVVDHFIRAHRELPERERAMLLGWRDPVEGLFEVGPRDGATLLMVNLVDEMTYRVHSNLGPAGLAPLRRGGFAVARLVPIEGEWLVSGALATFPKSARRQVLQTAAHVAHEHPKAVFRNPDKLARAWEIQDAQRQRFIEFFGSDFVVLTGSEVGDRMTEFLRWQNDSLVRARRARADGPTMPPAPEFHVPGHVRDSDRIALIEDQVEGLNFFTDFGWVEAAYDDPRHVSNPVCRDALLGYLRDDSVSPLVFRRLAARDPERASEVFRALLRRPAFSWERHGEKLLRKHKRRHFEREPIPWVVPLSDVQTAHFRPNVGDDSAEPSQLPIPELV